MVAAKLVNKKLMKRDQVTQELSLLHGLQHPHLVRLLDTFETPASYVLVLEMYVCVAAARPAETVTAFVLALAVSQLSLPVSQGRPRPSVGLHRELGQPHGGEGGRIPAGDPGSFALPA